jgi:hypothetical protein
VSRPATGQVLERRGKRGRRYTIRFRAGGKRRYITLGTADEGWTRKAAEEELERTLAAVKLGVWQPPRREPILEEPEQEPAFHLFASQWFEQKKLEGLEQRTLEHLQWALSGLKGAKTGFTEITLLLGSTRGGDRPGDRGAVCRRESADGHCRPAGVAITRVLDAGARGCSA